MMSEYVKQRLEENLDKTGADIDDEDDINGVIAYTNQQVVDHEAVGSVNYPPIASGEQIPDADYWRQVQANSQQVKELEKYFKDEPTEVLKANIQRTESIGQQLEVLMNPIERERKRVHALDKARQAKAAKKHKEVTTDGKEGEETKKA